MPAENPRRYEQDAPRSRDSSWQSAARARCGHRSYASFIDSDPPPSPDKWLQELFAAAAVNRATPLTVEAIATADDQRLDDWLWDRVCELTGEDQREALLSLSPGLRAFYLTRHFEYEVGNGGVGQYVSNAVNNAGTNFDLIADGYELLGLPERAQLVRFAAARTAPFAHMYRDGYEGDEPPEDDEIDRVEPQLDWDESTDNARLTYVRAHAEDFAI